jgi:hypothetical protein
VSTRMSYVLPFKAPRLVSDELLVYLETLTTADVVAEVIVVDGSAAAVFDDFHRRCHAGVRHVPVHPAFAALANGKVAGALTGLRLASQECVVLADEDVRYDQRALVELRRHLNHADVVAPQNFFDPLPWHACLDSARTLINRATGGDWPGTFGVRRSTLMRTGGYDGDVLFENLELVRTVAAAGGRVLRPLDLFVRRRPPRTPHFWSQRVRQAYDEFARPARLLVWLSVLPVLVAASRTLGMWGPALLAALSVTVAEIGRSIGRGHAVFPLKAALVAPLWVLERGICAWLALGARVVFGGVPYGGRTLRRAASSPRALRRRLAGAL